VALSTSRATKFVLPCCGFELAHAHRKAGFDDQPGGGAFKNNSVHEHYLEKLSLRFIALAGSRAGASMETYLPPPYLPENWTIVLVTAALIVALMILGLDV
jgi:hypothetical protein